MDTATATVLVLGVIMVIRLFTLCKHDWKVLHETKGKSRVEELIECTGGVDENHGISPSNLQKNDTVIVTCKKCGQIKRYVNTVVPG